jgi:hypothetical protein
VAHAGCRVAGADGVRADAAPTAHDGELSMFDSRISAAFETE